MRGLHELPRRSANGKLSPFHGPGTRYHRKRGHMNVVEALGKVLQVGEAAAPIVATAVNPAAGAPVNVVLDAVTKAEATGGSGVAKKGR